MADIVDIAVKETAAFTNQALADCRRDRPLTKRAHLKCVNCGAEIPLKRRAAVPGVKLCVDCQEEVERGTH